MNAEEILKKAIDVKQEIDEYILEVKIKCGWYGNKFVHLETCACDIEEDYIMDGRL